jgi:hypothetical protein
MYVELIGRWITGPLDPAVPARAPVEVVWPRLETGVVSLVLKDQNEQPIDLDLATMPPPDSLTLSIGSSFSWGPLKEIKGSVLSNPEVGRYQFVVPLDAFSGLAGLLIYDITVVKGSGRQAVVPTGYWRLLDSVFNG